MGPMDASISFEPLTASHWEAVRAIYIQGIATGNATFQLAAPEWTEWDEGHLPCCRIVAVRSALNPSLNDSLNSSKLVGWAALSAVSQRPVYRGVAEVSLYIEEQARGCGVGAQLMSRLIAASEAAGIWTLQAGIFPENVASIRLHSTAGFRRVGVRSRLGSMNGVWRDVVLMERRSSLVGIS